MSIGDKNRLSGVLRLRLLRSSALLIAVGLFVVLGCSATPPAPHTDARCEGPAPNRSQLGVDGTVDDESARTLSAWADPSVILVTVCGGTDDALPVLTHDSLTEEVRAVVLAGEGSATYVFPFSGPGDYELSHMLESTHRFSIEELPRSAQADCVRNLPDVDSVTVDTCGLAAILSWHTGIRARSDLNDYFTDVEFIDDMNGRIGTVFPMKSFVEDGELVVEFGYIANTDTDRENWVRPVLREIVPSPDSWRGQVVGPRLQLSMKFSVAQ